jgi:methanethiol S-methyltransferase
VRTGAATRIWAWGGAVLFVLSLGYFLFTYFITFGETSTAPRQGSTIAWDVGLFTVFALHHSVFARERVRAVVARFVPAQLERSFYVWVASLLLVAVCLWWRRVPGVAWSVDRPFSWALYVLQFAGLWLAVRSAGAIDIWDLAGIRQLDEEPSRHGTVDFKVSGPYGWVRHPIYTGWFLIVFAAPHMTFTRLLFAVVSSAYLIVAIPFEERSLRATSGGAYERYARQVVWKLIPKIY